MKLISDKPAGKSSSRKVQFGYEDLASSIVKIVDSSPRPFTIGLFGKWGTGKSTIVDNLHMKLDGRKYEFIKFDVWKYEADALRRSFLLETAEQLKGRWRFSKINDQYIEDLKKRLYTSNQQTNERFKISWRAVLVPIIVVGVVAVIQYATNQPFAAALSGAVTLITVNEILKFFLDRENFIQQTVISEDRVGSPEVFFNEFKNLLERKKKTYVIVIDNLDRTQKDKTVELLSTVKTFLNADDSDLNVIFVIASDDKAIKEHISLVYGNNNQSRFDANEFLKKFFNVVIELPVFIESEIRGFTNKLLAETDISILKDNTDVQQVINYAYTENPREIKQYVNNLATLYSLLAESVPGNGLTDKFIEDNLSFIAKMLVVRDRFPNVYNQIKILGVDGSLNWKEIEEFLSKNPVRNIPADSDEKNKYDDFSRLTNWCLPSDNSVSWYFRLRRSQEDMKLPGWDQFVSACLQQDFETAEKLFGNFEDGDALNNQLTTFITSIRGDDVRFTPFFSIYTQILTRLNDDELESLKGTIDLTFANTPYAAELSKIIELIDVDGIAGRLLNYVRPTSAQDFVKSVRGYVRGTASYGVTDENIVKISLATMNHPDKLKSIVKDLAEKIASHHRSETVFRGLSGLSDEQKKKLINRDALHNYLGLVETSTSKAIQQLTALEHYDLTEEDVAPFYIDKLNATARFVQGNSDPEMQAQLIHHMYKTFPKLNIGLLPSNDPLNGYINDLSSYLQAWYSASLSEELKFKILKNLVWLSDDQHSTAIQRISNILNDFVQAAQSVDYLTYILSDPSLKDEQKTALQSALTERIFNNLEQLSRLTPFANENTIASLIHRISDRARSVGNLADFERHMDALYKLYYSPQIQNADRVTLSQHIYEAILSGVGQYDEIVKRFMTKRFISSEQKRSIKDALDQNDSND